MKKLLTAFALAGLVSFTACGAEEDDTVVVEEPTEMTAPAPVVDPAPIVVDSGAAAMDTAAAH